MNQAVPPLPMNQAVPPPWDPERDEALVCVAVRPETHDVSTFVFAPEEPRLFRFLPGQFMTFDLPDANDAAGVQRCYTIASPPTRPWRIEITAKRTIGPGSGWLHRALQPGMRIRASGPMGDFSCEPQPGAKYLFLSAGSGITPLMSMSRTAHDLGGDSDIVFLHSARGPADLIFADELTVMGRRAGFRAVSILEADSPAARWDGFRGRLSPAILALSVPDLLEREIFCCGPAPYMAAARKMLDAAGFDRARYHEESFDFAAGEAPAPALPAPAPPSTSVPPTASIPIAPGLGFTIEFTRTGRSISCPPGVTVLAAARAAGLRLPSACTKGVCGTCKSRLASGTVEMRHAGGIRQREIDEGLALLCCSRPTSDLVIER